MNLKRPQVVFYINNQSFNHVNELSLENQEQLKKLWSLWEEKVWAAAYEHFLQEIDTSRSFTVTLQKKV